MFASVDNVIDFFHTSGLANKAVLSMERNENCRNYSAVKARGYFQERGRGLLVTTKSDAMHPLAAFIEPSADTEVECHDNVYWTLDTLKEKKAPRAVIKLVEQYDPKTQAVVANE
jgi:hypothetical protein